MSNLLFVGIGGFVGAIARYIVAAFVQTHVSFLGLPVGTLAVNVAGCLIFGFLGAVAPSWGLFTPQTRLLIFTGFLGSLTTYSTFGNDSVTLAQSNRYDLAFLHIVLHLIFGLGAVLLGQAIGQAMGQSIGQPS